MASFLNIFSFAVDICFYIIIAQIILSWLINFDIINLRQPIVWQVWQGLNRITAPVYQPIRRMLPDLGGLDLAPLIVIFGLYALQIIVYNNLAPMVYGG